MANRRMFSKDVIDSDRFLDMPPTAQNLYFHLGMHADDDGFVSGPKKVKRLASATDDDLKLLEVKQFIIPFESGVIVIADWKLNNSLRKDRYKETIHKEEKMHLIEKENGVYQYTKLITTQENTMATSGKTNGNQMDTQYSIEQNSKGQFSKGKDSKAKESIEQSSLDQASLEETIEPFADAFNESIRFQDCIEFYEAEFSKLGMIEKNSLKRLANEYGCDFLYEALDKTRFRENVQSPLAYITSLLKEWQQKGFSDVADIANEQEEFNEQFDE
ncbi:phage replisome organizer protein [Enterococcus lactis]|uniref:phage replisome organizer protein n=1 Tax=Enterococcus lactis TaxID=357441 RepID=UPI003D9879F9